MADRIIKAILLALMGLFALIVAGNNLVNLEQAHGAVSYVIGMSGNTIYPNGLLPPFGPVAGWIVLAIICVCEIVTGLLCLTAAYRLFAARNLLAEFEAALPLARIAAAAVVFVWFGLFWLGGVALFVMWQSEVGAESAASAFRIAVFGFLLLLYLDQRLGGASQ